MPLTKRRRVSDAVREDVKFPDLRDGYALVGNVAISSLIGAMFWICAARWYAPADLGLASALLNGSLLIGQVSLLGYNTGLVRFLPAVGAQRGTLIAQAQRRSAVMAAALSVAFVVVVPAWFAGARELNIRPVVGVVFVVGSVAWTVFTLQDSILTGLGRSTWVPAKNTVHSLVKLGLLFAAALLHESLGVLVAWLLPALLLVPMMDRRIRSFVRGATLPIQEQLSLASIQRSVAGDYVAWIFGVVSMNSIFLVVAARLGTEAVAFLTIPFSVALPLVLASNNTALAMVAAGPDRFEEVSRRVRRRTIQMVVPGVVVLTVGAPLILRLFGSDYADNSSWALRLYALAALPDLFLSLEDGRARVFRRTRTVIVLSATTGIGSFALSWALMNSHGINGVAASMLIVKIVVVVGAFALRRAFHLTSSDETRGEFHGP